MSARRTPTTREATLTARLIEIGKEQGNLFNTTPPDDRKEQWHESMEFLRQEEAEIRQAL